MTQRTLALATIPLLKNYPVIDAFYDGIATSIKTMDLRAKSYAGGKNIYSTLKGYIDKLADFNGAFMGRTYG